MTLLGAIIFTSLSICQYLVYVQAGVSCDVIPMYRKDCGWGGITEQQCKDKNCCYDSWRSIHCFFGKQEEKCSVPGNKRRNCGWGGITAPQCESRGCCFDTSIRGVPWCFHVDGGYSQWGAWSQCASCADQRSRSRTCTNPPPSPGGGKDCSGLGPDSETEECNSRFCSGECSVAVEHRVPCVSGGATAENCDNLGCCWDGGDKCFYGKSQVYKGCGEAKLAKRIVGGAHASPGEWPWHVQMHVKGDRDVHYCSGTLITPNWVITAAHCVDEQRAENIGLTLGELDLKVESGKEQIHAISKFIKHPSYSSKYRSLDYDFALMKLTKTVIMNDHVRAVCLPRSTKKLPVGTVCWETGWGLTSHNGKMSDYLKELEIVIVDPRKKSPYGVHSTMFITETKTEGHGTCRGDSGGPVVHEEDGRWYLEGVHSWGRPECAQKGYYDGQADVRVVLSWIIKTIMDN